jgi:hypothetical protein
MNTRYPGGWASAAVLVVALAGCATGTPQSAGTFFVTSKGGGNGADLGGLAGGDKLCQTLAAAAGLGDRTWHAYLSTQASGSTPAVNAKDRIGTGPWRNVNGVLIATNVSELHGDNNITKQTALTEKGTVVAGRGEPGTQHDILTGTQRDGTAFATTDDKTCGNWTKSGADGSAIVGHSDRNGNSPPPDGPSWNSAHATQGCSDNGLKSTGGAGYLYCFAVK